MENPKHILCISWDSDLIEIISFCLEGWGYLFSSLGKDNLDLAQIKKREPDLIIIDLASPRKELLEFCEKLKEDFITASVPLIILIEKRQMRSYLLKLKQGIDDYLIKPPDPLDLRVRIEMALRRTQYSFYTNSLTKLSGGRIIEEKLKEKLLNKEKFSFGYIDIDNFKYFNDKYGYLKGDQVITQTAYILAETVRNFGNRTDFIGHIGGDDFVFITTPDKEQIIAQEFIYQFDRLIKLHYSPEDRERGYIITRDRTNQERKIPLMSVSIAIVNNKDRSFNNILQINEAVAGIKTFLKKRKGSNFMIERRGTVDFQKIEKKKLPSLKTPTGSPHKPLGQILLERGMIDALTLDSILQVHWRKGIPLGEILKDRGILEENLLRQLLLQQSGRS